MLFQFAGEGNGFFKRYVFGCGGMARPLRDGPWRCFGVAGSPVIGDRLVVWDASADSHPFSGVCARPTGVRHGARRSESPQPGEPSHHQTA